MCWITYAAVHTLFVQLYCNLIYKFTHFFILLFNNVIFLFPILNKVFNFKVSIIQTKHLNLVSVIFILNIHWCLHKLKFNQCRNYFYLSFVIFLHWFCLNLQVFRLMMQFFLKLKPISLYSFKLFENYFYFVIKILYL